MPKVEEEEVRIARLTIEGFRGIEAQEIRPDGKSVVVEGPNGSCKTSLLESIMFAFTGDSGGTTIRKGSKEARVEADVGAFVVKRVKPAAGRDRLEVRTKDGSIKASPQAFLDSLVGSGLAFDPLRFEAMKPAEQRAALLKGLGVDLSKIDGEREKAYAKRTDVGRRQKEAAAIATGLAAPELQNLPEKIDSRALAESAERLRIERSDEVARRDTVSRYETIVKQQEEALAESRRQLAAARERVLDDAGFQILKERVAEADQKLASCGTVVALIERRAVLAAKDAEAKRLDAEYAALTKSIEAIDESKSAILAETGLDIDGLEIREDGIYVAELPLASLNRAARFDAEMRIADRLSPKFRVVLVDEASSLDRTSMDALVEAARKRGLQLWIARVAEAKAIKFEVWESDS